MSKFMNYVKKFLTLSFMSTVAAIGLSFNNVFAADTKAWLFDLNQTEKVDESNNYEPRKLPVGYKTKFKDSAETKGNQYDYDDNKKTAVWSGYSDPDLKDVVVPDRAPNDYPVIGAILGKTKSNMESIGLNCNNYISMKNDKGQEQINVSVEAAENLPNLKEIEITFDMPGQDASGMADVLMDMAVVNLARKSMYNTDLQKLLEKNSSNNCAGWFTSGIEDDGNVHIIGKSNLMQENEFNYINDSGIKMKWKNGGYELNSIPNQPIVVIPAAGVGKEGHLWELKKINLPNDIKTDKINTIQVTNIQDTEQKDRIIKYAEMMLDGLNNGENDLFDWELKDDDFKENGSITFTKIYRDSDKILSNMFIEFMEQEKLNESTSMSDEERYEQYEKIYQKYYNKLSTDDQDALSFFSEFLNFLKGNKIEGNTEDYLKGTIDSESALRNDSASSSDGYGYVDHMESLNKVLNIFSDVIGLFDNEEYSNMTAEERKKEYEKILDANFSGKSEQAKRARISLGRFIDKLYKSEFLSSLRSVSKFYGVIKDIYTRIQESAGQSVSDEEILDETIEIFNKRFGENSAEGKILKNIMTNLVDSGALGMWRETARDWKNNSNVLNSTSNSSSTASDLSRPEDANSLSTSSSSNSENSSNSGSNDSNSLSSSSSGSTDTNNTVGETTTESSKLAEVYDEFNNWLNNGGNKKTEKEQYTYLKNLLEKGMSSFSDDEKQKAKNMIAMIDDALTAADQQSTSTTGTSTSSGTSSTSTTKTTSSASTKTSDSSVSPELLSLILSGSLAGIGISLKKRHE